MDNDQFLNYENKESGSEKTDGTGMSESSRKVGKILIAKKGPQIYLRTQCQWDDYLEMIGLAIEYFVDRTGTEKDFIMSYIDRHITLQKMRRDIQNAINRDLSIEIDEASLQNGIEEYLKDLEKLTKADPDSEDDPSCSTDCDDPDGPEGEEQ